MNIAAFDLSLTATGWAWFSEDLGFAYGVSSGVIDTGKLRGMERLGMIRDRVLRTAVHADVVVVEGYAFARANQAHQLGELGGVVRLALYEAQLAVVEIPPANLKVFACGRGNAPKDDVFAAAIRKLSYEGNSHDEADALWLLQMALVGTGVKAATNEDQRRALAKLAWPERAGV